MIFILTWNILYAGKSWEYYYKHAISDYTVGNYDSAIEYFEKAHKRNPGLYEAVNKIADIYLLKNKKAEAIDYLVKSLEINASQPDIHCMLGELYEFYLQKKEALYHYEKAVKIDPAHKKAHYDLVKYYIKEDDPTKAAEYFNTCYNLGKIEGEKYYRQGIEEAGKKHFNIALELFDEAIKENPVMTDAYFEASEIYRQNKNYSNAIKYLEKIKEIKPDYKNLYNYLGHLYLNEAMNFSGNSNKVKIRMMLLSKSSENFKTAIEKNPNDSELYYLLVRVYTYMGDDEKAYDIMRKASDLESLSD